MTMKANMIRFVSLIVAGVIVGGLVGCKSGDEAPEKGPVTTGKGDTGKPGAPPVQNTPTATPATSKDIEAGTKGGK